MLLNACCCCGRGGGKTGSYRKRPAASGSHGQTTTTSTSVSRQTSPALVVRQDKLPIMTAVDSTDEKLGETADSVAAPNCKYSEKGSEACRCDDPEGSRESKTGVSVTADRQATFGTDSTDGPTSGCDQVERNSRCNGIGGGGSSGARDTSSLQSPPILQVASFYTGNACSGEQAQTSDGLMVDSTSVGDDVIPEYGVSASDETQLERVGKAFYVYYDDVIMMTSRDW